MNRLMAVLACALAVLPDRAPGAETEALFALLDERLGHMEDVALYKARNGIAVEDLAREAVVIADSKAAAAAAGLNPDSVEAFFAAQIAVAKAIQYRPLADWLSAPMPAGTRDLQTEIRPVISALGDQIVAALTRMAAAEGGLPGSLRQSFRQAITTKHVTAADVDLLFDSLLAVRSQ